MTDFQKLMFAASLSAVPAEAASGDRVERWLVRQQARGLTSDEVTELYSRGRAHAVANPCALIDALEFVAKIDALDRAAL